MDCGLWRVKESIGTILPMRVNVERCIKRENDSVPKTDTVWLQDNGKQSFHGILRLDRMRDPRPHCARTKEEKEKKKQIKNDN